VSCWFDHTVAVTEEGAAWSWGYGAGGRLGHNNIGDRLAPARVGQERFGGAKIVTADCGYAHSAAVSEDGGLFTWGATTGEDALHDVPTLVAPDRLLGASIGRGLPLEPLLTVAFAMGTHRRLGSGEAPAGVGCGDGRKSRRAAGKEPAEEGRASGVMALAGRRRRRRCHSHDAMSDRTGSAKAFCISICGASQTFNQFQDSRVCLNVYDQTNPLKSSVTSFVGIRAFASLQTTTMLLIKNQSCKPGYLFISNIQQS